MKKPHPSNILMKVVIGIVLLLVIYALGSFFLQVKKEPPLIKEDLETEQLP